jgi:hypothetical protein
MRRQRTATQRLQVNLRRARKEIQTLRKVILLQSKGLARLKGIMFQEDVKKGLYDYAHGM